MRYQAGQTLIHSALPIGTNHRSGGLEPTLHHHKGNARQHWYRAQRPSYRDSSSVMKSLLLLRLYTTVLPRFTRNSNDSLNLASAEDFAMKQGASLREGIQPSKLNRLLAYIAANYLSNRYRYIQFLVGLKPIHQLIALTLSKRLVISIKQHVCLQSTWHIDGGLAWAY